MGYPLFLGWKIQNCLKEFIYFRSFDLKHNG